MRISDWSSDVCSSDLGIRKGATPGASGVRGMDRHRDVNERKERITALANLQSRTPIPGSWAARSSATLRWAGTGSRRDRKSVVSGKSVSVRLDLGGRRILKKQKNS